MLDARKKNPTFALYLFALTKGLAVLPYSI
jgi:hypothetical protein